MGRRVGRQHERQLRSPPPLLSPPSLPLHILLPPPPPFPLPSKYCIALPTHTPPLPPAPVSPGSDVSFGEARRSAARCPPGQPSPGRCSGPTCPRLPGRVGKDLCPEALLVTKGRQSLSPPCSPSPPLPPFTPSFLACFPRPCHGTASSTAPAPTPTPPLCEQSHSRCRG